VSAASAGKLSNRIGYKTNLAACCILSAAFIALQGTARSLASLVLLRIAFGIAAGGLMPALNSLIKLLVPEEAHGRAFGLRSSASYIGFAIGPLTGGIIGRSWGLGVPFFLTGALLLAVGLWVVAAVRPEARQPA
jgi:MFS family permease